MRTSLYLIAVFCFTLTACTDFNIKNQGFSNLESLPESVSFNAPGDGFALNVKATEGGKNVKIEVEAPAGTLEDINVTYSLGGTATFGTDYTISGATSAENNIVTIKSDPSDPNNFDKGVIEITALSDMITDTSETIVITLVSAVREGKNVAVGRGGTKYGRTATVTINNAIVKISFSSAKMSTYENDTTRQMILVQLTPKLATDVTYTLSTFSSLSTPAGYIFLEKSPLKPGKATFKAGVTKDTILVRPVDNINRSSSQNGTDSIVFYITDIASAGVTLPNDMATLKIIDDKKRYGFNIASTFTIQNDTIVVDNIGTYLFKVTLMDTVKKATVPAINNITVNYSLEGTAVAGIDYTDMSGGSITFLPGDSSKDIVISVLRKGTNKELKIMLGNHSSTDLEIYGVRSTNNVLDVKIK